MFEKLRFPAHIGISLKCRPHLRIVGIHFIIAIHNLATNLFDGESRALLEHAGLYVKWAMLGSRAEL